MLSSNKEIHLKSFFLLYIQCEGPMLHRGGWVTPKMLQSPFLISQAAFPDLKINGGKFKVHGDPDSYLG